jgi:twitching motility protein PilU
VLSTLHSYNSSQTLERLLHFFPSERHAGIALQLSLNLNAIISQRLVLRKDGNGRVPAVEIMLATPRVRELLRKGDLPGIRSAMQSPASVQEGMQTFDYSIYQLVKSGVIDVDLAMDAADSPNDLKMRLKGLR